jgi:hypothetical protein
MLPHMSAEIKGVLSMKKAMKTAAMPRKTNSKTTRLTVVLSTAMASSFRITRL